MNRKYTVKMLPVLLAVLAVLAVLPAGAYAETMYLPGVTAAMSKPSYWVKKAAAPDAVLVTPEEIDQVNLDIIKGSGTGVGNLAGVSDAPYNGIARNSDLKKAAEEDAKYTYSGLGGKYYYDKEAGAWKKAANWDTAKENIYDALIDNCADPDATSGMPMLFAICTNRTTLRTFPTDMALPDDPSDANFDTLYLSAVSVGEPMYLKGLSADKKYYWAKTSYLGGWIPVKDVAVCENKAEWLSFWNFDKKDALVVCTDKIYTEDSNMTPDTARRMLTMGVTLQIAERSEWNKLTGNRYPYNNYLVWMPVRRENGTFEKQLGMISEHCKVSEGYLPLTTANLADVIFEQLGNTYGWGGMLNAQDCSGYVRDVYRCFGLNLGRNTNHQMKQPVRKFNLPENADADVTVTEEQKAFIKETIKKLPLGATLYFNGHAMIYLGCEGDDLYVISSVSNLVSDGVKLRVRGAVINTLDIRRVNGKTWMECLSVAEIPWYLAEPAEGNDLKNAVVSGLEAMEYTGEPLTPVPAVTLSGKELEENVHYTLSYRDNTEVGTAVVTVTGMGNYGNAKEESFPIDPVDLSGAVVTGVEDAVYSGSAIAPEPQVLLGGKTLAEGTDYTVSYKDNKAPGTASVIIEGTGHYAGTRTVSFTITEETGSFAISLPKKSYTWTGKAITPKVTASLDGKVLDASAYTVTYPKGRKKVGRYTVKAVLNSDSSRRAAALFTIRPKKTKITALKAGKRSFTAKWQKLPQKMSGKRIAAYQLQYATNKSFTRGMEFVTVPKYTKTSRTVKQLKKKKKYYVRIRTIMMVDGKRIYSGYSAVQTVVPK